MTNVITVTGICIEWNVQLGPWGDCTLESNVFTFHNLQCYLQYSSTSLSWNGSCHASYLYLKSNGELQSPVKVTVFASIPSKTLNGTSHTISTKNQEIWKESRNDLRSSLLSIRVLIHEENQDDKSVETPPYIDTRFSLECSSIDFAKFLVDGPYHDVEFAFGDQIIKAHKNILCCRSDVFNSMFQSDMVEGKTGRVNIQDMDATIFQQFLQYLYTGMLPELTVDVAVQLYVASDKYAVSTLKLQCAEFLIDNLSLENTCEILVLADRHNHPEFKKGVMEYIFKEKMPAIDEKWPDFCNENQKLGNGSS